MAIVVRDSVVEMLVSLFVARVGDVSGGDMGIRDVRLLCTEEKMPSCTDGGGLSKRAPKAIAIEYGIYIVRVYAYLVSQASDTADWTHQIQRHLRQLATSSSCSSTQSAGTRSRVLKVTSACPPTNNSR